MVILVHSFMENTTKPSEKLLNFTAFNIQVVSEPITVKSRLNPIKLLKLLHKFSELRVNAPNSENSDSSGEILWQ